MKILMQLFRLCLSIVGIMILLGYLSPIYGEDKIVTIATLTDYSPYCFEKKNSKPIIKEKISVGSDSSHFQGYSWDIVRESFQESGYTIILETYPWKRAMLNVERGMADVIFPAVKTEEREKTFYFSDEYVHFTNVILYLSKDSGFKWNGIKSLIGKRVGVIRGWSYGKQWEASSKKIEAHEVDSIQRCFVLLKFNRVIGIVGYEIPFDYYIKQNNLTNKYIKSPSINSKPSYLMGTKSNKKTHKILAAFDKGKREIIQNGKFDQIVNKWK